MRNDPMTRGKADQNQMPHSGESASQSEDLTMRSKEGGIMVDRVTHVTVSLPSITVPAASAGETHEGSNSD